MKNRVKIIIYYILEFLFSLSLFALLSLLIAKFTIYNPDFFKEQFSKNDYYHNLYESISEEMSNYISQSGFPEEVIENIYTEQMLEENINAIIDSFYNNEQITVSTDKVKENLETNMNNYLQKNNISIDDKEALNRFVTQMLDIYDNEITLSNVVTYIKKIISKTQNLIKIAIIALSVVSVLLLIIIFFLRGNVLSIAFLTSGLLFLIIYLYVNNNIDISNIFLWNKGITLVLKSIMSNILNKIKLTSTVLLIVGALNAGIYKFLHKKRKI